MNNTIQALQSLYISLGGSLSDTYSGIANGAPVSDYSIIPDCLKAIYAKEGGDLSEVYSDISAAPVADYSITPEVLAALANVVGENVSSLDEANEELEAVLDGTYVPNEG